MLDGTTDLKRAIERVARAQSLEELKDSLVESARELFFARAAGVHFLEAGGEDDEAPALLGVPVHLHSQYCCVTRILLKRVFDCHAPVHQRQFFSDLAWTQLPTVGDVRAAAGLYHYLVSPLIRHGAIGGMISTARHYNEQPFGERELSAAAALSAHVTERVSALRWHPHLGEVPGRLTPREGQIVELVVEGLTNAEVGTVLCISENTVKVALKKVFRKLEVSSRTELATRAWSSAKTE